MPSVSIAIYLLSSPVTVGDKSDQGVSGQKSYNAYVRRRMASEGGRYFIYSNTLQD